MAKEIIGYATGVFDLFHIGHLNVLRAAKNACDLLIVGVTTDELCLQVKGDSPFIPFDERVEILEALKIVDKVVKQDTMDKVSAWHVNKFDRMFVGDDWKGSARWVELENAFVKLGVEIVYFPYTKSTSSTKIKQLIQQQISETQ